jgi:aryl-alcohol dehydrogenase-like predicted oxidoreductase
VHGNDFGAHLGQVTLGYGPVEADHLQIVRPEVVPAADRGDIEEASAIPAVIAAARRHRATERQVALAWLLTRSPHPRLQQPAGNYLVC